MHSIYYTTCQLYTIIYIYQLYIYTYNIYYYMPTVLQLHVVSVILSILKWTTLLQLTMKTRKWNNISAIDVPRGSWSFCWKCHLNRKPRTADNLKNWRTIQWPLSCNILVILGKSKVIMRASVTTELKKKKS